MITVNLAKLSRCRLPYGDTDVLRGLSSHVLKSFLISSKCFQVGVIAALAAVECKHLKAGSLKLTSIVVKKDSLARFRCCR